MTQTKTAKKADTKPDSRLTPEEEAFERPDADTAAEGGPPHEHPVPSGADRRAPDNDVEHGYSQDSGYATSGGPSEGTAHERKRG